MGDTVITTTNGTTRKSSIDILPDDVLLEVFDFCQSGRDSLWNQRHWYKLTHTCRRWRLIILSSPSRLNLRFYCSHNIPVVDILNNSPPFPICVDYQLRPFSFSTNDEDGAFFALQKHDRVHSISLLSSSITLGRLFAAMDGRFSVLEELTLMAVNKDGSDAYDCPGLPRTFEAPHLRHLELNRVGSVLEKGLPILASLSGLISLTLIGIPNSYYLPIECLASRLSFMPRLQYLNLGFDDPDYDDDVGRLLDHAPNVEQISLLRLTDIIFLGDSRYLESLAARISAPHLTTFKAWLITELSPTLLYLSRLFNSTEELRRCAASITFSETVLDQDVTLRMACTEMRLDKQISPPFEMVFPCDSRNMQITRTGQICAALAPMFSAVKKLHLDFEGERRDPLGEGDDIERSRWRDLLRPFRNVLKLQIDSLLMDDLSLALHPDDDGPSAEGILPELCKLARPHYGRFGNRFDGFIAGRRDLGRHIIKCRRPPIPRYSYKTGNVEVEVEEYNENSSTELDSDSDFE